MNDYYNHIQYVVPEQSEICFNISPESRNVSLKLLDGRADVYVKDEKTRLQVQKEYFIRIWECLSPRLETETFCNFLVHENHYVTYAIKHGVVENKLFAVSPIENSYSFVLEKDIQLQIFPVESTGQESSITISSSRGATEIYGFKLSHETNYHLSPFSPVLLKSFDEEPYSVYVKGLDRKVKLFIRDENHHRCENDVKKSIFEFLSAKQFKHNRPTILVLGPENAGKTSFCQLLVNKTLETKMTPIYVDLNVKRNLGIPGSLSISEIDGRVDHSLDFKYNFQTLLHYGLLTYSPVEEGFYCFLVRKMGALLSFHLNHNSIDNSLSIIDTDGSLVENDKVTELILKSFSVDFVVYIGDKHCYENLKKSLLENVPSEFIPKPCNAEQPSAFYEAKYCQHRIQKHFFGSISPSTHNAFEIKFSKMTIYRISEFLSVTNSTGEASDLEIKRVKINVFTLTEILYNLLGVSAATTVELDFLTEVKYYVYITEYSLFSKKARVMVPNSENFDGGILLMGYVSTLEDKQIEHFDLVGNA